LEAVGLKVRSRALTTTLFARVCLGDLFMHGLGGGKYDELTDDLIRRFFGLEPPGYLVLTGTLRLPLPRFEGPARIAPRSGPVGPRPGLEPQRHLDEVSDPPPDLNRIAAESGPGSTGRQRTTRSGWSGSASCGD